MRRVPVGNRVTGDRPAPTARVVPDRPAPAQAERTLPDPRRTIGNSAVARMLGDGLLQRQEAPGTDGAPSDQEDLQEDEVDVSVGTPVLWFRRNSVQLRQDSQVDSAVQLAYAIATVREHLAIVGGEGRIVLHGYASVEGTEPHNLGLSLARAERVRDLLVQAGIARDRITVSPHGEDRSFPGRSWNRRVELELQPLVTDIRFRGEEVEARPFRKLGPGESELLARLKYLAEVASREGAPGSDFAKAVDAFRISLRAQLNGVREGDPLPPDVAMVAKALILWSTDPGTIWGEGVWDSTDVTLSAAEYATVPAGQNKCNTYVAEVVYRAVRVVHKVHESSDQPGRYFPYRAREWGDPSVTIPHFRVEVTPQMGDIWSSGTHVGIYLGEYAGKKLYVSARDNGDGVFALDEVQKEHGLQIKYINPGGVYRRYIP
jgi:outer membrane protein OmpA-like peptidoglycan-associated protein